MPITVEIVDQRGGASMSLHPNNYSRSSESHTIVEVVPDTPGPIFNRDRIEILVAPARICGITTSQGSQLPVEGFRLGNAEPRTILELCEHTHSGEKVEGGGRFVRGSEKAELRRMLYT